MYAHTKKSGIPLAFFIFFLEIQTYKTNISGFWASEWSFSGNPGLYFIRKSLEIQPPPLWGRGQTFSGIAQCNCVEE